MESLKKYEDEDDVQNTRPECAVHILPMCTRSWLSALPESVGGGGRSGVSQQQDEGDALHRCLCREVAMGAALLSKIRSDLTAVEMLCRGEAKATNEVTLDMASSCTQ